MTGRSRVCVLLAVLLVAQLGTQAATVEPLQAQNRRIVAYSPPSEGPVLDPFRPPAHVGGAGNRGIEYHASFGVARSAAAGVVVFSGLVAGRQVMSVVHADGVRTTYTGLMERFLEAGAPVAQGQGLGWSEDFLHFGAIKGEHYLDPQVLIDRSQPGNAAKLVPVD